MMRSSAAIVLPILLSMLVFTICPSCARQEAGSGAAGAQGPSGATGAKGAVLHGGDSLSREEALYAGLDDSEKDLYIALRCLMSSEQRMSYLSAPGPEEREKEFSRFWASIAPSGPVSGPALGKEFESRAVKARKRYSISTFPYLDKRGEALVRFGEPEMIKSVTADMITAGQDIGNSRLDIPCEVWYYGDPGLIVPFVLSGGGRGCGYYPEEDLIDPDNRELIIETLGREDVFPVDTWSPVDSKSRAQPGRRERTGYLEMEYLYRFYSFLREGKSFYGGSVIDISR